MAIIEKYEPGMFSWIELATSDAAAAKNFYTSIFGWETKDMPIPDGVYTILLKNGNDLGALYQTKEIPPNWATYISVANVDDSAKKATALGATLVAPPFDVMDLGRMAFVADPQGATFALWQAKKKAGAAIRDEANTLCWNELMTSDIEGSRDFYKGLLGWNLRVSAEYTEIDVNGRPAGGMMQMPNDMRGMPSTWSPYFAVDDCDATVAQAKSLGVTEVFGPMDIPHNSTTK